MKNVEKQRKNHIKNRKIITNDEKQEKTIKNIKKSSEMLKNWKKTDINFLKS